MNIKNKSGQTLIETLLVFLVLMILIFYSFFFGLFWCIQSMVNLSAFQTCRQIAVYDESMGVNSIYNVAEQAIIPVERYLKKMDKSWVEIKVFRQDGTAIPIEMIADKDNGILYGQLFTVKVSVKLGISGGQLLPFSLSYIGSNCSMIMERV